MTQTLLEIERQRALDAQRDALASQALYKFYSKHREVLDNEANTKLLREACGPDDLTLSALEFPIRSFPGRSRRKFEISSNSRPIAPGPFTAKAHSWLTASMRTAALRCGL